MGFLLGTALLAVVTALACALPGVFIVLRRNSMLIDGVAHAVFPGIVVGYLLTHDLNSPLLILGAALSGLLVVLGSEWLSRTGLLSGDAPQGLIFPALFSVGIILTTARFSTIHLDTHTVLVGDLNLAAFDQLVIGGLNLGPTHLYVMLVVLLINAAFLTALLPQLKATTFDPQFAGLIGIRTRALNLVFMFLVSVTVTAAFHAVGALLVIALVVAPPATAFLLSSRLPQMITLTLLFAGGGALAGFWLAYLSGAATSAGMAVFYGLLFTAVLILTRAHRRRHLSVPAPTPGADGVATHPAGPDPARR